MKHIVFKFIQGFGNRLCNLINMFYIHEKFPDTLIYITWIRNNHCNIDINDIFDMTQYKWIRNSSEYYNNIFPTYRNEELWATTSVNSRSRWDNIDEWTKHTYIVSVSFHFFLFVTNEYCINVFNKLALRETINTLINNRVLQFGINKKYIHFRNGDLVKLLSQTESSEKVDFLIEKAKTLQKDYKIFEYKQDIVERNHNDLLEAVADLVFLSKHNIIIGYCPYSHFSSWIFLLSSSFIDNKESYPIFNYKVIDIVLLDS